MVRLIVILALVAGAAYLTKPDEQDAEKALRTQLILALAKEDFGSGRSTGEKIALVACKLSPNDCYDLLRTEIDTEFSDLGVITRIELTGFDRNGVCYGAFTKFFCPGGLKKT